MHSPTTGLSTDLCVKPGGSQCCCTYNHIRYQAMDSILTETRTKFFVYYWVGWLTSLLTAAAAEHLDPEEEEEEEEDEEESFSPVADADEVDPVEEEEEEEDVAAAPAFVAEPAAAFVFNTSEESCLRVWVKFLLASARARVSSFGL